MSLRNSGEESEVNFEIISDNKTSDLHSNSNLSGGAL